MTSSSTQRHLFRLQFHERECGKQWSRMVQQQPTSHERRKSDKKLFTYDEVLVSLVGRLSLLFPSAHESSPWHYARFDLREMYLYHHALLPGISVPDFRDAVPRSANFQEDFTLYVALSRSNHKLCLLRITGRTSCKVRLMLFALRVSKIRTLVGMQC